MNTVLRICLLLCVLALCACTEQAKIDEVKQTAVPNCKGKTMQDLASGLLQNPTWGYRKEADGKKYVTVNGTIAGESLPGWVKEQKLMDITFSFPLDPKTGKYNPAALDGFPSLNTPEGVLQTYKLLTCS